MIRGRNIFFQYLLHHSPTHHQNCIFLQIVYFYRRLKKKIVFTPDESLEVIDVDSQVSSKYDSDTTSVLADDDIDSNFDTVEYQAESATKDEEISDEENLESDNNVEEESDESISTGDASVVESNEESEDESENES